MIFRARNVLVGELLWGACLAGALMLAPAVAGAAVASGSPQAVSDVLTHVIGTFLQTVSSDVSAVAAVFAGQLGLSILAACVAIRILMIVIPMMASKNSSDLGADIVSTAVTVAILLTLMHEWQQIMAFVWSGTDNLIVSVINAVPNHMGAPTSLSGDPLPALGQWVEDKIFNSMQQAAEGVAPFFAIPGGHGFVGWAWAHVSSGVDGLFIGILLLVMEIAIALVFAMMLFELVMSWAHIMIPMLFGPLMLAVYPVEKAWAKNLVRETVGAMLGFIMTAFMICLATNFIEQASSALQDAGNAWQSNGANWPDGFGVPAVVALYCGIIIFIGFSTSIAVKAAMALVGGNDHFSRHRGMGGALVGGAVGGAIGRAFGSVGHGVHQGVDAGAKAGAGQVGARVAKAYGNAVAGPGRARRLEQLKASRAARDTDTAARNAAADVEAHRRDSNDAGNL